MKFICTKTYDYDSLMEPCKLSPENKYFVYACYKNVPADTKMVSLHKFRKDVYDLYVYIVNVKTKHQQLLYLYKNIVSVGCICCEGELKFFFSKDNKYLVCSGTNFTPFNGSYVNSCYLRIYKLNMVNNILNPELINNLSFNVLGDKINELYYSNDTNSIYYSNVNIYRTTLDIYCLKLSEKIPKCIYKYKYDKIKYKVPDQDSDYANKYKIHSCYFVANSRYLCLFVDGKLFIKNMLTGNVTELITNKDDKYNVKNHYYITALLHTSILDNRDILIFTISCSDKEDEATLLLSYIISDLANPVLFLLNEEDTQRSYFTTLIRYNEKNNMNPIDTIDICKITNFKEFDKFISYDTKGNKIKCIKTKKYVHGVVTDDPFNTWIEDYKNINPKGYYLETMPLEQYLLSPDD